MKNKLGTIAFYNVENFYANTINNNENFLPSSFSKWIDKRYDIKVNNIAHAISLIGYKETEDLPIFVGFAEVENESVLKDIISNKQLDMIDYDYILYESLDERKINVGCIYNKDEIEIISSEPIRTIFKNSTGEKSYTRDVLYVQSKISENVIHFFIVHLPSKLDQEVNQVKRKIILDKIKQRIDSILSENKEAHIVVMGDFNDTPNADNIRLCLDTRANENELDSKSLFNPMVKLMSYKRGSLVHRKQWMLFDQILLSSKFLNEKNTIKHIKTDIFDHPFLTDNVNKHGAFPHRTFVGSKYLGGYSDHFPVFTIIKY